MKFAASLAVLPAVLIFATVLAGTTTTASGRDFKITSVVGDCAVKAPSASEFSPAEAGASYPWGSRLRTGSESQLVVELAEGGECRIMPNAVMTIGRDARDKPLLRIIIEEGIAQLALNEAFHESRRLEVETATLIATPTGTRFSVGTGTKPDVKMVVVTVNEAAVKVGGKHHPVHVFDIPLLKAGDQASVAASQNRTWYRIKNHKGEFVVHVPGETESMKPVTLPEGHMLRIILAQSEDDSALYHLTVLHIGKDGETPIEAWTAQRSAGKPPIPFDILEPSTLPVPTTTTTIPSPTPVGDR